MTDEELTEILGPKCDGCGWRQRPGEPGRHRPAGEWTTACPEWVAPTPGMPEGGPGR